MHAKSIYTKPAGISLLELIIVLAIIAGLLALLFPAVHSARVAAKDATCKNNLHQLALAMHQLAITKKKIPNRPQPNTVGGWAIDLLPFLEERVLADRLGGNSSISDPTIAEQVRHRPAIMTCPYGWEGDSDIVSVPSGHYATSMSSNREIWLLTDVSIESRIAWVASPEISARRAGHGPHSGGYFVANNQGDVRWFEGE